MKWFWWVIGAIGIGAIISNEKKKRNSNTGGHDERLSPPPSPDIVTDGEIVPEPPKEPPIVKTPSDDDSADNAHDDVCDSPEVVNVNKSDIDDNGQDRQIKTSIKGGKRKEHQKPKETKVREKKREKNHELICRDSEGMWCVCLKVSSSTFDEFDFSQKDEKLNFTGGDECRLTNFVDSIKYKSEEISLFNDNQPLIFRLTKDWRGVGKRVFKIAKKHYYIVIAPKDWVRIEKPEIAPEPCKDSNFMAHFFYGDTTGDGFVDRWSPIIGGLSFVGKQMVYDNSKKGDLFGNSLPDLSEDEWKNVSWVRVGTEGKEGSDKWDSDEFCPRTESLTELIGNRGGWFYIRAYDEDRELIDSFDFRFFKPLAQILVNDGEYTPETVIVPKNKGHDNTRICFVDANQNNLSVQPRQNNSHTVMDGDVAIVKPHPEADFTEWKLGDADIDIMTPRVWWQLDDQEWRDTPIKIKREEFYALRKKKMNIYTPMNMRNIRAGINGDMRKFWGKMYRDMHRCKIEISMYQFADEVANGSERMKIEIQCGDKKFLLFDIPEDVIEQKAINKPKPVPKQEKDKPQPILGLYAHVKTSCGWRRGRGFSMGELATFGAFFAETRRKVKVDKRRRTAHCGNIKILEAIVKRDENARKT